MFSPMGHQFPEFERKFLILILADFERKFHCTLMCNICIMQADLKHFILQLNKDFILYRQEKVEINLKCSISRSS